MQARNPIDGNAAPRTEPASTEAVNEIRAALADDATFRAWYERTLPRVYGYVLARAAGDVSLAEEVTQQVYVAAIDRRASFDGRADGVTWLCAIARHKLVDHFRRIEREERRQRRVAVREIALESSAEASRWEQPADREIVLACLQSLPSSQRAVLMLVALDGLSVPEAARLLGKSAVAAQSLLARARDGFRAAYQREAGRG